MQHSFVLIKFPLFQERNSEEWGSYWRELFRKITVEDIQEYERKYKGSEEEREDVRSSYVKFKGKDIISLRSTDG